MISLVTYKIDYKKNYVLHRQLGNVALGKVHIVFVRLEFLFIYFIFPIELTLLSRTDSSSLPTQPIVDKVNKVNPQTVSSKVSESIEPTILIWLIFGILIAVVTLNAALLFKLWSLEKELSIESMPDFETLR